MNKKELNSDSPHHLIRVVLLDMSPLFSTLLPSTFYIFSCFHSIHFPTNFDSHYLHKVENVSEILYPITVEGSREWPLARI